MSLERTLRMLLDSDPARLERDRLNTWDECTDGGKSAFVLFGAGGLGRSTRVRLESEGRSVLAFVDNDQGKWGAPVDGIPVLSPEEAVRRHGTEACFVVCIWRAEGGHRFQDTRDLLHRLGARRVVHFGDLGRAFPDRLLPHYSMDGQGAVLEAGQSIVRAADLMGDAHSRDVFLRHALWRITLDFDLLPPVDPREIYFPAGIIDPRPGDVLVDAGAFDGDTAARFLDLWGPHARAVHAFEPDPANARRFEERFREAPPAAEVHLHPFALGPNEGELRFSAEGSLSSRESASGDFRVLCLPLDSVPLAGPVGLFKLDVEGAEVGILEGAARILAADRPRLAVCLYHRQAHLWEIPLLLQDLVPGYRFQLINHGSEAWDLVLYASHP